MKLPNIIDFALSSLIQSGAKAYIVGGSVRDFLMGREPHDYDITTSATPDQIQAVFSNFKCLLVGASFATITVLIDHMPIQITTFRTETGYADHRRPDAVTLVTNLSDDLNRRDFTINAIAYNSEEGFVDPFKGQLDIESKTVRCVGDPYERFEEDALRILRALRFASKLSFEIEPETHKAMLEKLPLLAMVSSERILAELNEIVVGSDIEALLVTNIEIFAFILPELRCMFGFDQRNPHHIYDVFTHTIKVMGYTPPIVYLRWAALLHDIGKPEAFKVDDNGVGHFKYHAVYSLKIAEGIMKRLGFDNDTRDKVNELINYHDSDIPANKAAIKRWLNKLGPKLLRDLFSLKIADNLAQNRRYDKIPDYTQALEILSEVESDPAQAYSLSSLNINGNDLIALGLQPSKIIGVILNDCLEKVITDELLNDKYVLLDYVKRTHAFLE